MVSFITFILNSAKFSHQELCWSKPKIEDSSCNQVFTQFMYNAADLFNFVVTIQVASFFLKSKDQHAHQLLTIDY